MTPTLFLEFETLSCLVHSESCRDTLTLWRCTQPLTHPCHRVHTRARRSTGWQNCRPQRFLHVTALGNVRGWVGEWVHFDGAKCSSGVKGGCALPSWKAEQRLLGRESRSVPRAMVNDSCRLPIAILRKWFRATCSVTFLPSQFRQSQIAQSQ